IYLNIIEIEKKAENFRQQFGGKIFVFPIKEDDPYSKYVVTMYTGEKFNTYPEPMTIEEAAAGVRMTLEAFEKDGWDADYERNVHFISYEAQVNAPSVTMRRLKKENVSKPIYQQGVDFHEKDGEEELLITARGLLKWTYVEMVDEKNPKAIQFMDGYYKLLAMRKYGKTAAAIKQEIRRFSKDEGIKWIERTYKHYIRDDMEVMNLMQGLKG
ncbi:hypothetical protein, partial [Paenibacillus naphthalenovorans]|uniref:hypothetical protein n=1 Tax=Paenibacillus naphthalenovorans TaxID=162209 RepID=UPI00088DF424